MRQFLVRGAAGGHRVDRVLVTQFLEAEGAAPGDGDGACDGAFERPCSHQGGLFDVNAVGHDSFTPGTTPNTVVIANGKVFAIEVDPDKLRYHNISLESLVKSIKGSNLDVGAKTVETTGMEYIVRGKGFLGSDGNTEKAISDIEETVIMQRDGVPVRVSDVANVQLGPDFRRGLQPPYLEFPDADQAAPPAEGAASAS